MNGPDAVVVRPMEERDLAFTGPLHRSALSHGLFGELGPRFLRSYHDSFLASPFAVALVAERDGAAAAFLLGTTHNRPHYRWTVRHRGLRLALLGIVGLLRRPGQLWRFARTRLWRYLRAVGRRVVPRGSRVSSRAHASGTPVAVLTHMAVVYGARGSGIGSDLVATFLRHAEAAGARQARLVTLGTEEGAGEFYARLGWRYDHTRTDWDERPLVSYCLPLGDP